MGATWSTLPIRPRNSMAQVLSNIAGVDINNRDKVANILQKLKADSRMTIKSLRYLL